MNEDEIPEMIITGDLPNSEPTMVIEIYAIYRSELIRLYFSQDRLSYYLCENNIVENSGNGGANIGGISYSKYTFGSSLDSIGYLSYEYTDSGVVWTYKDDKITEAEANEIQNKYKAIKLESISLSNI